MSGRETKDASDTLDTMRKWTRDIFIIVGVIVLIVYPGLIGRFLKEAKIQLTYDEGAKTWTVQTAEENKNLATDLANLSTQALALQQQLTQTTNGKTDPALTGVSQAVNSLVTRATTAADSAAASLANQQAAPGAPEMAQVADGWMYLGKVSSHDGGEWVGPHYIRAVSASQLVNQRVAVEGNVFLRGGGPAPDGEEGKGWHARQKVIGAVKNGDQIEILNTQTTPAVDGGWAMWAQVKRSV